MGLNAARFDAYNSPRDGVYNYRYQSKRKQYTIAVILKTMELQYLVNGLPERCTDIHKEIEKFYNLS